MPRCQDLVRKMLVVDPSKRITAAEALRHPFIVEEQSDEHLHDAMEALSQFNAKRKFRAVAMACVSGARHAIAHTTSKAMRHRVELSKVCKYL